MAIQRNRKRHLDMDEYQRRLDAAREVAHLYDPVPPDNGPERCRFCGQPSTGAILGAALHKVENDDYAGCANFDRFGACMCSTEVRGMCRFHGRSGCCKGHREGEDDE